MTGRVGVWARVGAVGESAEGQGRWTVSKSRVRLARDRLQASKSGQQTVDSNARSMHRTRNGPFNSSSAASPQGWAQSEEDQSRKQGREKHERHEKPLLPWPPAHDDSRSSASQAHRLLHPSCPRPLTALHRQTSHAVCRPAPPEPALSKQFRPSRPLIASAAALPTAETRKVRPASTGPAAPRPPLKTLSWSPGPPSLPGPPLRLPDYV